MTLDYKKSQLEEILDQLSLFTGEEAEGMRSEVICSSSPQWVGTKARLSSRPSV